MGMNRRRFLERTALSTSLAAGLGLAGCTGTGTPGGGSDTTTTTTTTTTTKKDSGDHPTTRVLSCPNVRDTDRHVCLNDDIGSPHLVRSKRAIPADGGTLTITLENRSDESYGLNPYAWHFHRETDSGWELVDEDRAYIEPWHQIDSGASLQWWVGSDRDAFDGVEGDGVILCAWDLEPGAHVWSVELMESGDDGDRFSVVVPFLVE